MELCYIPSLLISILVLNIIIQLSKMGPWTAGLIFASPAILFALLSFYLCKKGHKKMAWCMPIGALLITGAFFAAA